MRLKSNPTLLAFFLLLAWNLNAQTFTMGKKCREQAAAANELLAANRFSDALQAFDAISGECKTKDGREVVQVGRAEALNGLGNFEDAIAASDVALKATKNRSLSAHFQKAIALNKLGRIDESKAELSEVINLTEMNQNTAERASNYALMGALYDRQMHDRDSAMMYLDQAIVLDPDNPSFYVQKGDMYVASNDYDQAYDQYDKALEHGMNELDLYIIKSEAGLKMLEHTYGTSKAQELRDQMTEEEKARVCGDLTKALDLGWQDMNKDMFAALVCK